jgi:hypothetical protein
VKNYPPCHELHRKKRFASYLSRDLSPSPPPRASPRAVASAGDTDRASQHQRPAAAAAKVEPPRPPPEVESPRPPPEVESLRSSPVVVPLTVRESLRGWPGRRRGRLGLPLRVQSRVGGVAVAWTGSSSSRGPAKSSDASSSRRA